MKKAKEIILIFRNGSVKAVKIGDTYEVGSYTGIVHEITFDYYGTVANLVVFMKVGDCELEFHNIECIIIK